MNWILYILKCNDNSLYTGITNNLERRLNQHLSNKGAKYTKGRGPFEVIYEEICTDRSSALKRELEVKSLSKNEKTALSKKL